MRDEDPDVHPRGSTPLGLILDRTSRTPLHQQLADQLQHAIVHGQLVPGSLLTSEPRMAEEIGLSRITVRHAIKSLTQQGLLVRLRGIGTLVAQGRAAHTMDVVAAVHEDLREAGRAPAAEVQHYGTEPASAEVAAALALAEGSEVTVLDRLQYADGLCIGRLRNHLPRELLGPDLFNPHDGRLNSVGLHGLMRTAGIRAYSARCTIGARAATAEEGELLDVAEGTALLTLTRTTLDQSGRPVEYGTHCYPPAHRGFDIQLLTGADTPTPSPHPLGPPGA
ncbi:DNA-binding transcriptional regulator, GntR family [Streptomyces sp. yr375]|uniref:GntR family transcriptional regulator n=1 Tax=Streptomyces sp. yr375 TaxID=1761906 RepID=UPI0008D72C0F|nr:GntR family transcriptional regulator [Streptomyces sp. yr375]SER12599.1 DNA-binding transcriptional regulator, GntR family [Streptomyces sp. yr375]